MDTANTVDNDNVSRETLSEQLKNAQAELEALKNNTTVEPEPDSEMLKQAMYIAGEYKALYNETMEELKSMRAEINNLKVMNAKLGKAATNFGDGAQARPQSDEELLHAMFTDKSKTF